MHSNRLLALVLLFAFAHSLKAAPQDRIRRPIDTSRAVRIAQPPKVAVTSENDLGPVDPSLMIEGVTLAIRPSPEQQKALEALLETQRDPSSPEFHRWLTPEEFGDRFGASQNDVNAVVAWLRGEGLVIDEIARGRNFIVIKGTAAQLSRTFQTAIHYYGTATKTNYANRVPPSIPEALTGVVTAIRGLDDFRLEPMSVKISKVSPKYNGGSGTHYLAPDDWTTIYNVNSLYQSGIDGTGQKIAVVGQTDFSMADIQTFRTKFNLPANTPQVVLVGRDPGTTGDVIEAVLDLEWVGAVARNATIYYVNSTDVFTSAQYVINQNLAPVISMSYGGCEAQNSSSLESLAQQANAQGITWLASSGDSGAAACDSSSATAATHGLAVNIPASFPEVTAIGGTTFAEGAGSYWSPSSTANFASALGYIPETAWNDTALRNELSSTGGGVSIYYSKPSWQAGAGVPNDGMRDVPDISFSASADHDGYLIYYNGGLGSVGGTSAPTPAFAGVVGLLNQTLLKNGTLQKAGLGNINPTLYHLSQSSPSTFHDIVSGNNIVPCTTGTKNCTTGSFGYSAGTGYDLVTGLGSADIGRLVTGWSGVVASVSTTTSLSANPASISPSSSTQLTATVAPASGTTAPTGSIAFTVGTTTLGTVSLTASGSTASAVLTVPGSSLATGSNTVVATYGGNTSFAGSSGSTTVTVTAATTASATFVKADTTTQGNWQAAGYGTDGYVVIGDNSVNPSYASPVPSGNQFYTWASSTNDVRATQKASNPADRIASTWYSNSFILDTNISDQAQHQVAIYCLDWDSNGRRQTVDVLDSNGNVLNTQTLSASFNGGVYLIWNVTGHVKFRFTLLSGYNAVMSGIFFSTAAAGPPTTSATFVKADTTTQGSWRSVYGTDGYIVIGDNSSNPAYASPVASGNQAYTWASSTSDVRAVQKASNPSDRIASTWYSNSFTIDTNISDQAQHQVALYCLDWDSTSRRQTVDVLDNNGNVLNTQSFTASFNGGVYLVWNVIGHVKFRFTLVSGYNAVVSGIFFH